MSICVWIVSIAVELRVRSGLIWIQAPHPRSRCCCPSAVIHTRSTSDARHAELQIREANPEAGVKMVFEPPINIFGLLDILRLSLPAGCRAGSGPGPETTCQARRSAAGDSRSRLRQQLRSFPLFLPPDTSSHLWNLQFRSVEAHHMHAAVLLADASQRADPWLPHADRTRDLQPPVRLRNGLAQSLLCLLSPPPAVSIRLLCAILPMSGSSRPS